MESFRSLLYLIKKIKGDFFLFFKSDSIITLNYVVNCVFKTWQMHLF